MKDCIFHYVMAILEGGLSGVICYEAGKAKEKNRKILLFVASAAWFVLSLTDSFQGSRALRQLRMEKAAEEGEYDE